MAYLRLAKLAPPEPAPEHECVAAFDRELDYVFASLRRLGARSIEVEDLAQEIFLVLLKHWPTVDTTRSLRPYLFGIAYRIFYAHRRRRQREMPLEGVQLADDDCDPETLFRQRERTDLLHAALERVPLPRRAVIIMHEIDEVPIREVARRLSRSEFGTYARLHKGMRELKAAVRRLSRKSAK